MTITLLTRRTGLLKRTKKNRSIVKPPDQAGWDDGGLAWWTSAWILSWGRNGDSGGGSRGEHEVKLASGSREARGMRATWSFCACVGSRYEGIAGYGCEG